MCYGNICNINNKKEKEKEKKCCIKIYFFIVSELNYACVDIVISRYSIFFSHYQYFFSHKHYAA